MDKLEQTGIFRCKPLSWEVVKAKSGAVGINMSFLVVEELDGDKWLSWDEYDDHMFYGTWWVVKKDGTVNQSAVEQLAKSLGWNGDIDTITDPAPDTIVQVTVKEETYEGVKRWKGDWMNPADHTGGGDFGVDGNEKKEIKSRFGSLLKAAASSALPAKKAPPKGGPKSKPAPKAQTNEEHAAARAAAGLPSSAPVKEPGACGHTLADQACDAEDCAGNPF